MTEPSPAAPRDVSNMRLRTAGLPITTIDEAVRVVLAAFRVEMFTAAEQFGGRSMIVLRHVAGGGGADTLLVTGSPTDGGIVDQVGLDLSELVDQALGHADDFGAFPPDIDYALRCGRCGRIEGAGWDVNRLWQRLRYPCTSESCEGILRPVLVATTATRLPDDPAATPPAAGVPA